VIVFGCDSRRGQEGTEGLDTTTVATQKLIEVDCEFAEMGADSGLAVAFVRFAADSAIILRNGQMPIIGKEAIGQSFGSSEGFLQWEPQFADISGDLGYTFGRYQYNPGDTIVAGTRQGSGKTSHGYYVTIWKRIDGTWRYVLDTGISTPKAD
jgi:ketosteroid isomerase-like protein